MNVSRNLFRGSNIEALIVLSCETVVRSGTDLTCGTVGNRVSGVAFASGGNGFVQPGLDGAALGHPYLCFESFSNLAVPSKAACSVSIVCLA